MKDVPNQNDFKMISQIITSIGIQTRQIAVLYSLAFEANVFRAGDAESMMRKYVETIARMQHLWEVALANPENFRQLLTDELKDMPGVSQKSSRIWMAL